MSSVDLQTFKNVEDSGVRQRIQLDNAKTQAYLDLKTRYVLNHRAVQHPLLTFYTKNAFREEQEKKFYLECYYYFQYEPFYIAGMANNTRDYRVLKEIILNVVDEVGGEVPHAELFRRQLNAIGISSQDIETYQCLPTTTAINSGAKSLYTEPPIERNLGALFADETMSAVLASQLNAGLENQGYDEQVRKHWLMHIAVEVGHSNNAYNAIAPYVENPRGRQLFDEAIDEYLGLLENYWDGVDSIVRPS